MFNKILVFVGILILLFQVSVLAQQKAERDTVSLQVSNPYKFDAEIEIKCDWNGKEYLFYRKMLFKGKEITTVTMPNTIKVCQLWSHINLW